MLDTGRRLSVKLAHKLFIIIFGGSIITIAGVAYIGFTLTEQAISQSIEEQQLQLAKQTMDKVDRLLYERYVDIQTIAGDETVEEFLSSIAEEPSKPGEEREYSGEFLRRIQELSIVTGPWESIDVLDNNGKVVYSLDDKTLGKEVIHTDHQEIFKKALAGHAVYSDVHLEEDGSPTMLFATPIRNDADPSRKQVGAVVAHLSWPTVLEVINSVHGPIVDLYNSEGLEIANNDDPEAIFKENNAEEPHLKATLEGKEDSQVTKGIDGEETVSSSAVEKGFLTYKGNGWVLLVEQPTRVAFAPASRASAGIGMIVVPLIIVMNVFMLFAILRMLRPIQQLTQTSKEIAQGDLSKRVRIDSRDEIGQLGKAFNEMANKLQDLYKGLEQKVQEKTAELAQRVEESEEQKNLLGTVVHNVPLGIALTDPGGQAILVNEAETTLLGPGFFKLKGSIEQIYKVTKPDGSEYPYEELTFVLAQREGKPITKDDLTVQHPDSRKITIRATSAPIKNQQGNIVSIISVFEDITKERDIDRMKTEFISLASHQLRTPLSAIKWFSEMLVGGDAGDLTPEQKDFAQNISDSTQRMIDLVNALLNVSRMESGRIVVDPKPTDLKELVDTLVKELQVKLDQRQLTLIVSVHQDLPKINVDPRLIRQVYMNLLTNAIKYTPKGGEISVFISKKDNEVISQVSDNGYGIPKFEQSKMFQKFFRATNVIKIETDGTGLGLYLIKAIIDSSKGRLWFESFTKEEVPSGKKEGTTFWFSLPMSGMEAKKGEVTLDE